MGVAINSRHRHTMTRLIVLVCLNLVLTASSFVHQTQIARSNAGHNQLRDKLHMTSTVQSIAVGEHEVRLRHQLFLGDLKSKGGDLTGLKLWPTASLPMLDRLRRVDLPAARRDNGIAGDSDRPIRILELGSGCGLLGIGIAALGEEVVLTDAAVAFDSVAEHSSGENGADSSFGGGDGGSDTLRWLRGNIELNRDIVGDRATAQKLLWGDEEDMAAVGRGNPFDLIIGSELLYNNDASFPGLAKTLRKFAAEGHAPVLLGYKTRRLGEDKFFDALVEYFDVRTERLGRKGQSLNLAVCHLRGKHNIRH